MSVTAKFIADFTSFNKAVESAEVKLRGFESGASSVSKQLARMGDSYSGRKTLQEATLAAKAVESIGGVSKLTASEQQRLNGIVTEALAKYKALGLQAPKDLQAIQKETAASTSLLDKMRAIAGPVGTALASAFAVTAIVSAGKKVLDFAGNLSDLSDKTGISTTGLQKLDLAFGKSGISLDTVTTNVTKLAKSLIDGDKSAVGAMSKLGLSVESLKKLAPEQQFIAVADAIGKVQNPTEKAHAAMTIFGRGGAELLAGLTGDLSAATEEFERLGLVMSEETIAAADDFGDQIGFLGRQLLGVVAEGIAPMLPALSALIDMFGRTARVIGPLVGTLVDFAVKGVLAASSAISRFVANILEMAQRIPIVGKHLGVAGDAAAWLREQAAKTDATLVRMFTSTTQAGAAAATATPPLIGLGKATSEAAESAEKAAAKYAKFRAEVAAFEDDFDRVRIITEQVANSPALKSPPFDAWLPSLRQSRDLLKEFGTAMTALPDTVKSSAASVAAAATSIMKSVTGAFADLPKTIMSAITGGGDVGKAIGGSIFGSIFSADSPLVKGATGLLSKGLGSTIGAALGSVIPGVGTLLGAMAGQLLDPLMGKIGSAFKAVGNFMKEMWTFGLAGGPSAAEKEGRSVAAAFREELERMLTDVQRLEAGNDGWKRSVIAVRDAYIAAGRTEQDALAVMDRLWKAEKQGGDAVKKVIAEIEMVTRQGLTPSMQDATTTMLDGFQQATSAAQVFRDELSKEIVIPIRADWSGVNFGGASRELVESARQNAQTFEDFLPDFLARNPGDDERAWDAFRSGQEGVFNFHTGGLVGDLAHWRRAHRGLAVDEVPIVAQTGEGILSRTGMAALDALNRGGWNGGGGYGSLQAAIVAGIREGMAGAAIEIDGDRVTRAVARRLPGTLATMGVRAA